MGPLLGKLFQVGKGFGMTASRKRLERSPKHGSRRMKRRMWIWSVRLRGPKDRVPRKEERRI